MLRTISLIFILGALVPATALAAWGPEGNCKRLPNEDHCYGLIKQIVTGTGAYARVGSQGSHVPEPSEDGKLDADFITNELWVRWEIGGGEYWIETGEITGTTNCCSRWRFYAQSHPHSPFYYNIEYAAGEIPLNQIQVYGIAQCGGPWCITWNGQTVHSFGGWPTHFEEREAGVEIATEQAPYAPNGAHGRAYGEEGNGEPWLIAGEVYDSFSPGVTGEFSQGGDEVYWGLGTPQDRIKPAKHRLKPAKHRRHRLSVPIPRGSKPPHGHVTVVRDPQGRVTEMWIGKRPTQEEREQHW